MTAGFDADKRFMLQRVPEKDNELAHGLDIVLKDIVIRTAVPFYEVREISFISCS